MLQLTLTIGRGSLGAANRIGEARKWDAFVEDTKALVRRHGYEIVVANFGTGEWEGQSEPNFHVVGIAEEFSWPSKERRDDAIRHEVRQLAHVYGQNAIALGFGQSELIEGA